MNLIIRACEGGFYITKLIDGNLSGRSLRSLCRQHGLVYKANMRFHSLGHIRDYFAPLAPANVWLEHNCAYDEMIGLPGGERNYRQPLYWFDSSFSQAAKSA